MKLKEENELFSFGESEFTFLTSLLNPVQFKSHTQKRVFLSDIVWL